MWPVPIKLNTDILTAVTAEKSESMDLQKVRTHRSLLLHNLNHLDKERRNRRDELRSEACLGHLMFKPPRPFR